MIPLFPFQQEAVDAVFRDWAAGHQAVVVSLPTGAGKTLVAATIAQRAYHERPEPILVLVPSDEILRQTVDEIAVVWEGIAIGIIQQQIRQWRCPLLVASVATLVRHLDELPPMGLVITDEAHHADAPMWQAIYRAIARRAPHVRHVGLTATPFRTDRGGDAHALAMFPTLSYARSMFDLIAEGFLAPLCGMGIHSAT
ncbi:MAG: DEAD/DEAH box helicase family protein, partial [Deltaproteobacteria bacterium]|nr:DEAD/DEAH box helicase family protein [Deltaproteobacteria bacterium]